jgi:hypothetical protein
MGTLADCVCLPQPLGEFVVELLGSDDPEAMDEQTLRVWTGALDPSVLNATLKVEIPSQGCLPGGYAGETSPAALERNRSLRHGVPERATRLGKSDEIVVKGDDLLRLVAQVSLDGPFVRHEPRLSEPQARAEDSLSGLSLNRAAR